VLPQQARCQINGRENSRSGTARKVSLSDSGLLFESTDRIWVIQEVIASMC
jgi:hypothetical protein